jgi:hypothetical protein
MTDGHKKALELIAENKRTRPLFPTSETSETSD